MGVNDIGKLAETSLEDGEGVIVVVFIDRQSRNRGGRWSLKSVRQVVKFGYLGQLGVQVISRFKKAPKGCPAQFGTVVRFQVDFRQLKREQSCSGFLHSPSSIAVGRGVINRRRFLS